MILLDVCTFDICRMICGVNTIFFSTSFTINMLLMLRDLDGIPIFGVESDRECLSHVLFCMVVEAIYPKGQQPYQRRLENLPKK